MLLLHGVLTDPSDGASRRMGVYVVDEVGSETYVRRSGAWVKADSVSVRRWAPGPTLARTCTCGAVGCG